MIIVSTLEIILEEKMFGSCIYSQFLSSHDIQVIFSDFHFSFRAILSSSQKIFYVNTFLTKNFNPSEINYSTFTWKYRVFFGQFFRKKCCNNFDILHSGKCFRRCYFHFQKNKFSSYWMDRKSIFLENSAC